MRMQKINWKWVGNHILRTLKRKSPEILTGVGIGGMVTTTVLAVKATPEAMRRIEAKKKEERHKKLTAAQTVQAAWKCYIPAGMTATVSVACLIGASTLSGKRNAALATAASLTETSLREYRGKVIETIGEKKESSILDAIDHDRVEKNPPPTSTNELPVVEGPVGRTLCYDGMFGRYFYSDVETLKRAENKLNRQMATMTEPYISLNEFYMEIGLTTVDIGEELGWNVDSGLIELRFSSQLVNGRTPCLVVSHLTPPSYDYNK